MPSLVQIFTERFPSVLFPNKEAQVHSEALSKKEHSKSRQISRNIPEKETFPRKYKGSQPAISPKKEISKSISQELHCS